MAQQTRKLFPNTEKFDEIAINHLKQNILADLRSSANPIPYTIFIPA